MARMATYVGDSGLTIAGAEDKSRTLYKGHVVDLDEVLVPAVTPKADKPDSGRPARTMEWSIGKYMHLFTLEEAPKGQRQHKAKSEPEPDAESV